MRKTTIQEIKERHIPITLKRTMMPSNLPVYLDTYEIYKSCTFCGQDYPCDARILIEELEELLSK